MFALREKEIYHLDHDEGEISTEGHLINEKYGLISLSFFFGEMDRCLSLVY